MFVVQSSTDLTDRALGIQVDKTKGTDVGSANECGKDGSTTVDCGKGVQAMEGSEECSKELWNWAMDQYGSHGWGFFVNASANTFGKR